MTLDILLNFLFLRFYLYINFRESMLTSGGGEEGGNPRGDSALCAEPDVGFELMTLRS